MWYNIITERERTETLSERKEIRKMTKTEMINFIESTGMVVNFDRKYFARLPKESVKRMYDMAVAYAAKKN